MGGLLVFTVWMTATYARDGRPYDAQLLRDLPHSGAPDLATLAVSDALASALTLLILIPLTALASARSAPGCHAALRAPDHRPSYGTLAYARRAK